LGHKLPHFFENIEFGMNNKIKDFVYW